MPDAQPTPMPDGATGVLVLASGAVLWGRGFGAEGAAVGAEVSAVGLGGKLSDGTAAMAPAARVGSLSFVRRTANSAPYVPDCEQREARRGK